MYCPKEYKKLKFIIIQDEALEISNELWNDIMAFGVSGVAITEDGQLKRMTMEEISNLQTEK